MLGITWLVIMACMLMMHGRMYYPAPAYPMLFAAGGVALNAGWRERTRLELAKPAYAGVLVVTGIADCAVRVFPDAERGAVHSVREILAL